MVDQKKLAYWSGHNQRWQASGLTLGHYCQREGLALSSFDRWRRLMRQTVQSVATPESNPAAKVTLLPIQVERPAAVSDRILLQSPAGWKVTLPSTSCLEVLLPWLAQLP